MNVFLDAETVADREDLRLVDVRDGWEFDGIGHLPGAVSIPFEQFRSADDGGAAAAGMLPGPQQWGDLLSAAGIERGDTLVAYDDTHGVFAARFVVTALAYGHDPSRLFLLDGDYSAWSRERPVSRETVEPTATSYEPTTTTELFVDFEAVRAAVDDDEVVIVDTREPEEYEAGHVPGAVQLDWRELVDTDGTRGLRPRAELETTLADHGITPDRRVILYCNTARRISHTYLVCRHLSYDRVGFYEGSLTEWRDRGGPVETGV
jgi:thiosulfate/3-mercaptopyruvate sulfurtransferase